MIPRVNIIPTVIAVAVATLIALLAAHLCQSSSTGVTVGITTGISLAITMLPMLAIFTTLLLLVNFITVFNPPQKSFTIYFIIVGLIVLIFIGIIYSLVKSSTISD